MTLGSPARIAARDALASLSGAERDRAAWRLSESAGGAFPWYLCAPARRRRVAFLGCVGAGAIDSCLRFESGVVVTNDAESARLARALFAEAGARAFDVTAPASGRVPLADRSCDVVALGPGASELGVPLAAESARLLAPGGALVGDAARRVGLFAPDVAGEPDRPLLSRLPRGLRLFPQEPGRRGTVALRGFPALDAAPRPSGFREGCREMLLARPSCVRSVFAATPGANVIDALLEKFPPTTPRLELTPTGNLAWFGAGIRVEAPITRAASVRARRNADRLRVLAEHADALGAAAELAPRLVDSGSIDGVEYFVEALRPGVTLSSLPDPAPLAGLAIDLLLDLHRRSARPVRLAGEALESVVRRPILDLLGFGAAEGDVRSLADAAARRLEGLTIPLVLAHGDFGPGNVLVDSRMLAISGLIDWDLAADDAPPFSDAAHLATRLSGLPLDSWRETPGDLVWRYALSMGLEDDASLDALAVLGFARARRAHLSSDRAYDPDWVEAEFTQPVRRFLRAVGGASA